MHDGDIMLSDAAQRYFRPNFRYHVADGEDFARTRGWSGFGFVTGSGDDPLPVPGDDPAGARCVYLLEVSNAHQATQLMEEAAPGKATAWNGHLVYDYGDLAARAAAERIGSVLAEYPVLSDEDFSARERANAIQVLTEHYNIPTEAASDVASALSREGHALCEHCERWDVHTIMRALKYRACVRCDGWIPTTLDRPLHYDCAALYQEGDCACVPVMVDGYRHGGHVVTMPDVLEILRGCAHCYPLIYPCGKHSGS